MKKQKIDIKFNKTKKRLNVPFLIVSIIFGIYGISLVIPLVWGLTMSFQDRILFITDKLSLPTVLHPENYANAFYELESDGNNMFTMFFNSFWYAFGGSFFGICVTIISAYVCAKYKFALRGVAYWMNIIAIILPVMGTLPARYKLFTQIHIIDSPLVLISALSMIGMNFVIAYSFFKGVSWEYAEAAFIDGAGHFRVFWQIMLPMASSPIIAMWLTSFITEWNDSSSPLIFLKSYPTLASGFYIYQERMGRNMNYPVLFAGLFVAAAPIVALYLIFQDKLMSLQIGSGMKG